MSLNLHLAVRGAIPAVNPDIKATYIKSLGRTVNADGSMTPAFAPPAPVMIQVQPPTAEALQHKDYVNSGKVIRSVYLFSDPLSVVRIDARGGDFLQFPQWKKAPIDNWLIFNVEESFNVSADGWSKVSVVLQTDRPAPT